MKKLFFYITIIIFSNCTNHPKEYQYNKNLKLKSPIKEIVDSLTLELGMNYQSDSKNYLQLIKVSTEEDLIRLTDHVNPAIRCYAFKALIEKKYKNANSILINHLYDKQTLVDNNKGCIKTFQRVNSFMFREITSNSNYKYKLDSIEYLKIEKIIFEKD